MPAPRAGDVVLCFDGTVRPPKHKRMVCVCAGDGWFFRINTTPLWRPHVLVEVSANPRCLDHDSYIELRGVLDLDMDALADEIDCGQAKILGSLAVASLKNLLAAVNSALTLTDHEKRAISASLMARLQAP